MDILAQEKRRKIAEIVARRSQVIALQFLGKEILRCQTKVLHFDSFGEARIVRD
jgi:hypothetical protein